MLMEPEITPQTYDQRLKEYLEQARERSRRKFEKLVRQEKSKNCTGTARQMWYSARNRAAANNIPFEIEASDIVIPTHCPVLGIELKRGTVKCRDASPSLDRIIPSKGYVPGNIVVVSFRANRIKNNSTVEELLLTAAFYEKLLRGSAEE